MFYKKKDKSGKRTKNIFFFRFANTGITGVGSDPRKRREFVGM